MDRRAIALSLVLATVLSTGCGGDPRAASKENFQHAIDAKLGTTSKLCLNGQAGVFSDTLVFPYRMLVAPLPSTALNPTGVMAYDAAVHRQLAALVAAGLATKRMTTVKAQHIYEFNARPSAVNLRVEEYDHGPEFAKYANGNVTIGGYSNVGQLCFASLQVDHVDDYSQPGQMMGATMSEVHYHAKVVGIADWASTPAMRSAFPTIEEQLRQVGSTQQSDIVVLMNDGWKAQ